MVLKPVLPYVSDFVSHTFFYAHHMATMHYENGKYHVHYETARASKDDSSDKPASSSFLKKDTTVNEHIVTVVKQQQSFMIALKDIDYPLAATASLVSCIVQNNYPPPRL
ncbi:hypothetical protein GCM10027043_06420 [Ferruginibacter profundus]